jgi:hypothetical protein
VRKRPGGRSACTWAPVRRPYLFLDYLARIDQIDRNCASAALGYYQPVREVAQTNS